MNTSAPQPALPDYERLGLFYLGRPVDPATLEARPQALLYDSRDLTTHAVCVGMTGSGKTGLCLALLEEAALDGIPALAIDPKGDVANLLLTFPALRPDDFRPWIDEDEARRQGKSPDALAAKTAETWRRGLADWDEDGERIGRLRESAEVRVYTPGSDAGIPISVLSSFAAPPGDLVADPDLFRDRVVTVASSVLGLLGRDADPVQSREHVLLSRLLEEAWRAGRDLELADLIRQVQSPPFDRIGVLDLEAVFPARERMELAMALNNLLASPGFAAWLSGESLDLDRLLYTAEGRPRIAVVSIAHLSDAERMFFVTLLLTQALAWMRRGSGSGSLRALLYMDELFGYMPPVAEPPSKRPLLTLLKQARAYGLGLVLATQNPADLDYKGLANAGTWMIGRLQTERDRERVIEGLLGASEGGLDRDRLREVLGSLGKRMFVLQNAHEPAPVLFQTRWALSYLAGPMTRQEIARLMAPVKAADESVPVPPTPPAAASVASPPPVGAPASPALEPPVLPAEVPQAWVPAVAPLRDPEGAGRSGYRPGVLGLAQVRYVDARRKIDHREELALLAEVDADAVRPVEWAEASEISARRRDLATRPPDGEAAYREPPAPARDPRSYREWEKGLADHLYRNRRLSLLKSAALGALSEPGEDERAFRIRLAPLARAERDRRLGEVEERYGKRLAGLDERIRRAEERYAREQGQASERQRDFWISSAASVGAALFGRRSLSRATLGRATTAARGLSRVQKERQEAEAAAAEVARLRAERDALAAELEAELRSLATESHDPVAALETVELAPRRADVTIDWLGLAWVPEG